MLITIANMLDASALSEIRETAKNLEWRDGALTAGATARQVKRNEQADLTSTAGAALHDMLLNTIQIHEVVKAASLPRQFSRLMLSRTSEGGGYGLHIDNAIMGAGAGALRADMSFTLFLSDPETYEGGELVLEWQGATQICKPPAGHMVLYPSTALHRVETVSSGERLACVGWIQSLVPDLPQREILFDLQKLRGSLHHTLPDQSIEMLTVAKIIANLMRHWAKP